MKQDKEKAGFFKTYFNPGFVLMSVMIGGGFATGREILQFGGIYGAKGWIVGVAIAIGFAVLSMLSFEIARLYRVYDYRSHLKIYAGPLTIVFDIIYFILSLLILSVMSSATGNILQETIGLPYYAGVILIVILAAIVIFFGQSFIEKVEVWGGLLLYISYIIFAFLAISGRTDNIIRVFAEADTHFLKPGTNINVLALFWVGLLYVGYNSLTLTTCFFVLRRQKKRKEALWSGLIAGCMVIIPWLLTYFALMAYYPSKEVFGAPVPWLAMMQNVGSWVVVLFSIVCGWTLVATAVGIMNAVIDRLDKQLLENNKQSLSRSQKAIITTAYLIGSVFLSKIGIIDLIAKGYTLMSYGLIASFIIPLITVGLYKIIKKDKYPGKSHLSDEDTFQKQAI
ncbi:hypothetical protein RBH88_01100 [Aminobacterium sp. MB27-C1]|jgi:uncharacterized membrane protein YkvI|uniref:YkvI family membrane protein n=1 Tax=Aminobacterium sp. MB27-C1 TaxID=3070661 RepID=UPI001BCDAC1F|nr:hypothetical protein [Aminobacterium sp. MB27-C1]WMI71715.1 hypothetical protein RBH88_01100 [Aminobacterium sp. MB27-C1]